MGMGWVRKKADSQEVNCMWMPRGAHCLQGLPACRDKASDTRRLQMPTAAHVASHWPAGVQGVPVA